MPLRDEVEQESAVFFERTGRIIKPLTVQNLLAEMHVR
jgi:hypothetical protein